jgi:hypothetical protein
MEWIWIVLFGSFIALTNEPIDLDSAENEVHLREPIVALTSGASLYIDVAGMVPKSEMTIDRSRMWVERNVPKGCLKATVRDGGSAPLVLEFSEQSSFEPGAVFLILAKGGTGMPVRQKFKQLSVVSCMPLRQVRIYWRNYQK